MSDHVASLDNGWGWLGSKKERNVDVWIFVPTVANQKLSLPDLDLRVKPAPKKLPPRQVGRRLSGGAGNDA